MLVTKFVFFSTAGIWPILFFLWRRTVTCFRFGWTESKHVFLSVSVSYLTSSGCPVKLKRKKRATVFYLGRDIKTPEKNKDDGEAVPASALVVIISVEHIDESGLHLPMSHLLQLPSEVRAFSVCASLTWAFFFEPLRCWRANVCCPAPFFFFYWWLPPWRLGRRSIEFGSL